MQAVHVFWDGEDSPLNSLQSLLLPLQIKNRLLKPTQLTQFSIFCGKNQFPMDWDLKMRREGIEIIHVEEGLSKAKIMVRI